LPTTIKIGKNHPAIGGDIGRQRKNISAARHLITITFLTLILTGMLILTYLQGTRLVNVYGPQIDAAMKIKMDATLAHLKLEEALNSDMTQNMDAAWQLLNASIWYAHAILEGDSNDENTYLPIADANLRSNIREILAQLNAFRHTAGMRLKNGHASTIDVQHFHSSYETLLAEANHVETGLHQAMRKELKRFQDLEIALVFLCLFSGGFVAWELQYFIRQINTDMQEIMVAKNELALSNRELASFAYVASHDLREPLRKIQAFGDRLQDKESDNLSKRGKDYVQRMQNAAARMKDLIEALLNLSRIGTAGETFARTDLNAVMHDVLEDLEERITETNGRIDIADLPEIDADSTQIRQLFQNLISNALKFRRTDVAPEIQVSAKTADGMCILTFTDNGIGFEPEYSERIFGVFQRLHGRDAFEGTGIGLSICRKTAERHGGSIVAEGRLGDGATFILTLPIRQRETI